MAFDSEMDKLRKVYPAWEAIARSPEFYRWMSKQPQATQNLQGSTKAADAIYLLNKFKEGQMANFNWNDPLRMDENWNDPLRMDEDDWMRRAFAKRASAQQEGAQKEQRAAQPPPPKYLNNKLLLTVKG